MPTSYASDPELRYRALLSQYLGAEANQPQSQYPIQAIANALAQGIRGYNLGQAERQLGERKTAYSNDLAQAMQPQPADQIAVTPRVTGTGDVMSRMLAGSYDQPTERPLLAKLLESGNPDIVNQYAPMAIQSEIQQSAAANRPVSRYEAATLGLRQQELGSAREDRKATMEAAAAERETQRRFQEEQRKAQQEFTANQNSLSRAATAENALIAAKGRVDAAERAREVKPMTDSQALAAGYADRMINAHETFDDPKVISAGKSIGNRVVENIPLAGNFMVSKDYQLYDQASRDFINANLRRESGAVISQPEFDNAKRQYLPQPGDSPDVLAQKKKNRETAINALARAAGQKYARPSPEQNPMIAAPSIDDLLRKYQ